MNVAEIVFSPTVGTEKVARIIGNNWSKNIAKIDLIDAKIDFTKCEITERDMVNGIMVSVASLAIKRACSVIKENKLFL